MEDSKSIADIIRVTATNQSTFLNSLANHMEFLEQENAHLKFLLEKAGVNLEQTDNK